MLVTSGYGAVYTPVVWRALEQTMFTTPHHGRDQTDTKDCCVVNGHTAAALCKYVLGSNG